MDSAPFNLDMKHFGPAIRAFHDCLPEAAEATSRTKVENALIQALKAYGALTPVIDAKSAAEQSLSQIYYLLTGESPKWSPLYGVEQIQAEIEDRISLLRYNSGLNDPVKPGWVPFAKPAPDVSGDWVLVPREPTEAMIAAFFDGWCKPVFDNERDSNGAYRRDKPWLNGWVTFLLASPAAPASPEPVVRLTLAPHEAVVVRNVRENPGMPRAEDALLAIIDRLSAAAPAWRS